MNKIFLLVLISFIFNIHRTFAQTYIVGKLLNTEKEAIPFATVALLKSSDSSIVKGTYTDVDGKFEFEKLSIGKYLVKSMVVGMQPTFSQPFDIITAQKELVLEDVIVQKSGVDLKTVDVVAIKPLVEFKNGNITLNVENSTLAAGNSAYDLLKRAPGVTIDNNNNISIQGKKGVKIMIDGRMQQLSPDQLANMLQSMSAEGISTIEIMKNPSVKYDAEGTAGIIQIKTKKAKLIGFNGNVNAGISKGELWSGNGGFALNYKGEKFAITSNFNAIQRNRLTTVLLNRRIKTTSEDLIFDQKSVETKQNQANDYKLGVDWFVNNKTTLGIVWDGGTGNPNQTGKNITNILGNNTVGFNYLEALSTVKNNWNNNNININALHKLDTLGAEIDASFNYTKYQEKGNNGYGNYFYDATNVLVNGLYPNVYKNTIHSDIDMFIGAFNFKKPLAKKTTIETGLKYSGVNTNNDFLFERKDTIGDNYYNDLNYSNNFLYSEKVAAGYFNYQKEFKKLSMQLGLRGEYTNATGFNKTINSKIIREYFQLFPNISFDYKASEKHAIQFSYNRRINRPDYFQLNPFKYYIDQYTANQGNPFLNPETSHNLTLTHSFMGALYNTLSYSRTENSIMELISQNDVTKETTQISKNINSVNQFAYNLFAYIPVKKIYVAQLDFSAWYQSFEGNVNGVNFNFGKPSFQLSLTNEFILPKEFNVEISGQYTGALQYGIMQIKPQGSVDIGIKKSFLKNKFIMKLNASDMFYTNLARVASTFDNQNFTFKQYADTRRVRLTITYNFGNTKLKFNEHNKGNEAEKNRLKKN
jgi:hypothetical protein